MMKALYCNGKSIELKEIKKPVPAADESLIRVKLAGICNTDIEITNGYMGFKGVPGHEFVGIVEQSNVPAMVGKRVTGEINIGCGVCVLCLSGDPRHCKCRDTLGILNKDGAMGEFLTLRTTNLKKVPDEISDEEATLIEPLAAAYEITEQINVSKFKKALVLGDGKLGLLTVLTLSSEGLEIDLIGHHIERNRKMLPSVNHIPPEEIKNIKAKYNLVVEATGTPEGFNSALDAVKPRGIIILKSTFAGGMELNAASIVINEITIIGSRCGRFDPAIVALAEKKVQIPAGFFEKTYSIDKAEEAFRHAQQKGALKVLIKP